MKFEVEIHTTKSDKFSVEASSLEEAIELAKSGKGQSMNDGKISSTVYGRPVSDSPDSVTLATGIRQLPETNWREIEICENGETKTVSVLTKPTES